MSDQVTNKPVAEEIELRAVEMVLSPPTSASDNLLSRIATLLFVLVAGLLTLLRKLDLHYGCPGGISRHPVRPVVVVLEKLHLPRSLAAAAIVLAG